MLPNFGEKCEAPEFCVIVTRNFLLSFLGQPDPLGDVLRSPEQARIAEREGLSQRGVGKIIQNERQSAVGAQQPTAGRRQL